MVAMPLKDNAVRRRPKFSLRLSPELIKWTKIVADRENTSLQAIIEQAIRFFMADYAMRYPEFGNAPEENSQTPPDAVG